MNKFSGHILVVDDDDGIRTLVKQYLNEKNFLVTTAKNAEDAKAIKQIPIWIFNGDGDKGVKGSRISFKALKDAGAADVRYHEYKSQGHVIDDFAYFTDGFMEWMFSQKRKK